MADTIGTGRFVSIQNIEEGDIIDFVYDNDRKYALVLNPNWNDKVHALKLERFDAESLIQILKEVKSIDNPSVLYDTFKDSKYVENRGYRTYKINKMSLIRKVFLKEETET